MKKGFLLSLAILGSHGLGLWEVNKILKKHNNLNLHTTKNEEYFKQVLEIYDK